MIKFKWILLTYSWKTTDNAFIMNPILLLCLCCHTPFFGLSNRSPFDRYFSITFELRLDPESHCSHTLLFERKENRQLNATRHAEHHRTVVAINVHLNGDSNLRSPHTNISIDFCFSFSFGRNTSTQPTQPYNNFHTFAAERIHRNVHFIIIIFYCQYRITKFKILKQKHKSNIILSTKMTKTNALSPVRANSKRAHDHNQQQQQ